MSINLPSHYVLQFANTLQLLLQQKGSKLRPYVMSGSHVGEKASPVDQVGSLIAEDVTQRFAPIGRQDAAVDRRWVSPTASKVNQLIDSFDKLQLLMDPSSIYVQNALMALGRRADDHIIDCMFAAASTGKQGSTSTSFPSANQVAVNQGSTGNTGLTVAKLRKAKQLAMAAEVDLENDPLTAIVTSIQHDNLLAEAQVISTDFNDRPVMVDGKVTRFLGINIVHCERLDVDGSSYRRVPVFAKSGVHLGIWKDMQTDISQRNDLESIPWQAYVCMMMGATRVEENKVFEIKCAES